MVSGKYAIQRVSKDALIVAVAARLKCVYPELCVRTHSPSRSSSSLDADLPHVILRESPAGGRVIRAFWVIGPTVGRDLDVARLRGYLDFACPVSLVIPVEHATLVEEFLAEHHINEFGLMTYSLAAAEAAQLAAAR